MPSHQIETTESGFEIKPPTIRQIFYVFVIHGIGAMIISGGINFAIAYGMYHSTTSPVRLFRFPNTLAGDSVVTLFVQTVVTNWVEIIIIDRDIRVKAIEGLYLFSPPKRKNSRLFFDLDPNPFPDSSGFRQAIVKISCFLLTNAIRALILALPLFLIIWPAATGILTAVGRHEGNDYYYNRYPAPQLYKLVYGGIIGLVVTPLLCSFRLLRHVWMSEIH